MKLIHTSVEVDLSDWSDNELIDEITERGYTVDDNDNQIAEIEWRWRCGDKKEALLLLERQFKNLIGISDLVD